MKFPAVTFIASLTMILGACATFNDSAGLDVSVVGFKLNDATLLETTAVFTVRLENEGPVPIMLEGGVHKFYLNGILLARD
jgi:LEA14-like dessication related protein